MTDYVVRDTQLTSVADAIRTKGGTSDPLSFPDGFVDAVEAIPTGGGPVSVPAKEVNFRDYDGTVVYAYTPAEFATLSAMPANPDHSHDEIPLTSQGWNWSFSDAQAYVAKYGRLEVGQMYITTDGKTHIVIYIDPYTPASNMSFTLRWTQTVSNGVTIDWDDGSTPQTYSGTGTADHSHTYIQSGIYDITLDVTSGSISFGGEINYSIFGAYNGGDRYLYSRIQNVRFGNGLSQGAIGGYTFYDCVSMKDITIPAGITSIGTYAFDYTHSLAGITIPMGVSVMERGSFTNATGLCSISLPRGMSELLYAFYQAHRLTHATVPDTVTVLNYTFRTCESMQSLVIPESVETIETNSFTQGGFGELHFTRQTPPLLPYANAFKDISTDYIIYVPRGSLNAYKTATNWSTLASHMQEEPQ